MTLKLLIQKSKMPLLSPFYLAFFITMSIRHEKTRTPPVTMDIVQMQADEAMKLT